MQFVSRQGYNTSDAITSMSHLSCQHLQNCNAYAWFLFAHFSSAFNTVWLHVFAHKLQTTLKIESCIKGLDSFLTDRVQQVKVKNTHQTCNIGVPQGAASSPVLFILDTRQYRRSLANTIIIKFSDDTNTVSLLQSGDCPSTYHKELDLLLPCCKEHRLTLNVIKTTAIVF